MASDSRRRKDNIGDVSLEYSASWASRITFHWIGPFLKAGSRRLIRREHIWRINPARQVNVQATRLRRAYRSHSRGGQVNSLLWALHDVYRSEFWAAGVLSLVAHSLTTISPLIMFFLLRLLDQNDRRGSTAYRLHGGLLIGALLLVQQTVSLAAAHAQYTGQVLGTQIRSALISIVFSKALLLSNAAKAGSWNEGTIANLVATDVQRIEMAMTICHMAWTCPIMIICVFTLLYMNLGYSVIPGIAFLVCGSYILQAGMKMQYATKLVMNTVLDTRTEASRELIQSLPFIKYQAWTNVWIRRIKEVRAEETEHLRKYYFLGAAFFTMSMAVPVFSAILIFATYSLTGHELHAAEVFSSLSLFTILRMPMNRAPHAWQQTSNAWASLRRIQEFLMAEEMGDIKVDKNLQHSVLFKDASFSWDIENDSNESVENPDSALEGESEQSPFLSAGDSSTSEGATVSAAHPSSSQIKHLDIAIKKGEFVAIIGRVGSGKSSLLSAIAGQMPLTGGDMVLGGETSYCAESPWILSGTFEDNITFGHPFDSARYDSVITSCALNPDLNSFSHGSKTQIGERGITLSGGQKQRVGLARAMYAKSPILLLDDPLSSVDARVGRHIFEEAITGPELSGITRIVATHQLHILSRCDRILWLDGGGVKAFESYDKLLKENTEFAELVQDLQRESMDGPTRTPSAETATQPGKESSGPTALIKDEYQDIGHIPIGVYWRYLVAAGLLRWCCIALLRLLGEGANVFTTLWLSWWISGRFGLSRNQYIGLYVGIGAGQSVFMFGFMNVVAISGLEACTSLLSHALERVSSTPMSFVTATPTGRILSLFTRDVESLDNSVAQSLGGFLMLALAVGLTLLLLFAYLPWMLIALPALVYWCIRTAIYYRRTTREMKRHETVLKSVGMAQIMEALTGSTTIRSYGAAKLFEERLVKAIDEMSGSSHLIFAARQWLGIRLDAVGNSLFFITSCLVTFTTAVSAAESGALLSYSVGLIGMIPYTIVHFGEVEDSMIPVERMSYYGRSIPCELETFSGEEEYAPRPDWPSSGKLCFENVSVRYSGDLELVLDSINLDIPSGSKVAVVGRTGAGKTTLTSTIFRMTPLESGRILVDGVDIASVPRDDLRSRLAIIPQDPTLFKGNIRSNLDPSELYPDSKLETLLQLCGLTSTHDAESTQLITLCTPVSANGTNLSFGQRQLVCLARALARDSKILVCDEATSGLDLETDKRIQAVLKDACEGRTVLFVAHRVRSVLGFDTVVVMEQGQVVELGKPRELWSREGGIFRSLCDGSAIRQTDF